ncbi:MAG: hypothetical protein J7539_18830, partial [Niabella sp.]|nr:hypothetical protein [Niabella sp.]
GDFTPYFAYKIGNYENGYYLNFPKEPLALPYKNEIFNKLHRYDNEAVGKYLDFHYELYQDKRDFLRFLYYELSERINQNIKNRMFKLNTAFDWTVAKREEQKVEDLSLSGKQQDAIKEEIKQAVSDFAQTQHPASSSLPEQDIKLMTEKLSGQMEVILKERMESILSVTDQQFRQMTNAFHTGNIELNNSHNEDRLIQLFILLQEVLTPAGGKNRDLLFKRFSAIDIAAMLKLHFAGFKEKQPNTIQKRIAVLNSDMKQDKENSDRIKNLEAALSDFFY